MGDELDTRKLVRIYSFHAEERLESADNGRDLGRILSSAEPSLEDIVAPWRKCFEPWEAQDSERDPVTAVLSVEAAKLQKQWLEFRRTSPKEDQVDISETDPTIEGVISMTMKVGKIWQERREKGKRGKAKSYFHRLCGTLDAHSNMLQVVPSGNEYVSLFSGTITSIIKASVNHESVAEDLAQVLCEISEHVADCEVELELFKTEDMQRAVADLYAHIFLFLTDALSWYMKKRKKRMMDSFNEKFRDGYGDSIENIKRKSEIIKRKAAQNVAAEQRVTRLTIEEARKDVRVGLEGVSRELAEMRYLARQSNDQFESERAEWREAKRYWRRLYENATSLLTEVADSYKFKELRLVQAEGLMGATSRRMSSDYDKCNPILLTREELSLNSAGLEDFFHRDRIRLDHTYSSIMVDPQALAYVAEWTQSKDADILSIAGPHFEGDELEDHMTMLAAKFIDFATESKVPTISYFCELRRRENLIGNNDMEMQGFLQMVYGLIRQMIELVLPELQTCKDLSAGRFSRVDGTAHTWDDAMNIFDDVQEHLPGRVFCIIDGFQWLDSRSTDKFLTQFVELLRRDKLKVLLTTTGESRCLTTSLSRSELLILDNPLWGTSSVSRRFEEAALAL